MKSLKYILLLLSLSLFVLGRTQGFSDKKKHQKESETVKELTEGLLTGITNDSLKILTIYKWITDNISYDYGAYMSGEPIRYQSAELVCRKRKTTCTGYANLLINMLKYAEIKSFGIEGFTHDFNLGLDSTKLSSDHAWVAFNLNGNWMLADPTWDAGEIGMYRVVNKEEIKKSFWKRLKSFRFKYLFNKKKREKNKTTKREKITYKLGFIRKSSTDYIFIDPNKFVKSHLPNVAHFQMKTAPISVSQFCDSTHALGNKIYSTEGNFNFNQLNDIYFGLERPERLLWLSDSSLFYHPLNHGDKALHAHNYLAHFYGEKSNSPYQLEHFVNIADTVILHGTKAIRINQKEFGKKRTEFNLAFQLEKKQQFAQQKQVNFIREKVNANSEIYRKGRERMKSKEIPALSKMRQKITTKFGNVSGTLLPVGWDTIPEVKQLILASYALRDSILLQQSLERSVGNDYGSKLNAHFLSIRKSMVNSTNSMYNGVFLNEAECLKNDQIVLDELKSLSNFLRDSVNCLLGNRKSFAMLTTLDRHLKLQENQWAILQEKDSLFPAWEYFAYSHAILYNLIQKEEEVISERLQFSEALERHIKQEIRFHAKELGLDMKDLANLKTLRQAYLSKLMNNKYNRSIRVYKSIINNAKKWKSLYKMKLKNMEK